MLTMGSDEIIHPKALCLSVTYMYNKSWLSKADVKDFFEPSKISSIGSILTNIDFISTHSDPLSCILLANISAQRMKI